MYVGLGYARVGWAGVWCGVVKRREGGMWNVECGM